MAKHTTEEMEKLPFDELRASALAEAAEPQKKDPPAALVVAKEEEEADEPEVFESVATYEIDLEDGSGKQVFEAKASGGSQLEADLNAHKAAAAKSLDAHKQLIKHKRQVEAENRDFRNRSALPKSGISDDDKYRYEQTLKAGGNPVETYIEIADKVAESKAATLRAEQEENTRIVARQREAAGIFVSKHPDYIDSQENTDRMLFTMREKGLSFDSSESFSKAYEHLKRDGLLRLKGEEANADTDDKAEVTERIAQPKVEPTQQRTKKASGISTQSSRTAAPANTELSEAELYSMPLEKLKHKANEQMSGR